MKADVTYYTHTYIGVEGKTLSEILDKVCQYANLNALGRAKLLYKIRNN
jgi:hypothetical protein